MILVREIQKSYGPIQAVDGISFQIQPGEVVGLLGPNGAGKSTTLRILTCFLTQDSGTVTIDGLNTYSDSLAVRQRIGYLPESAPLYPEMSPKGYLDYRARLFGFHRRDRAKQVASAMDRCQIAEVARRRIGTLSKGYRQRVGLAAALLCDPPVLILDEPSNGLDPTQILQTRSLISELSEKRTMIVSSHILPEIERLANRIIILAGGKVQADGPLASLTGKSDRNTYVAEVQTIPADYLQALRTLPGVQKVRSERCNPLDGTIATDSTWHRLTITADASAPDPRPKITSEAASRLIPLREMTQIKPSLEECFLRAIEAPVREASQ